MSEALNFEHYPLSRTKPPRGWAFCAIDSIASEVEPGFPTGKHNQDQRGTPHLRPMNINRYGRLDRSIMKYFEGAAPKLLREGDVLFNNTNSPELVGKTTYIPSTSELSFSNHMTKVSAKPGIDPRFLALQIHFLWMTGYFRHRCVNHVNQASIPSNLLRHTVPVLVPPYGEQSRIADALDEMFSELDAAVEALRRAQAKLALYRASVLNAAVRGDLTTDWRRHHPDVEPASVLLRRILAERRQRWEQEQLARFKATGKTPPANWKAKYKEPAAPDTASLSNLPETWRWASVAQIGLTRLGRQRAPKHHAGKFPRPYLRVANVYEDRLDLSSVYSMNFTPEEFAVYALLPGDILLNEGQSLELVGRSMLYGGEIPGACFTNTLIRFRAVKPLLPAFAQMYFKACLRSHRFRLAARVTTNIAHLGGNRFSNIEFPLPPMEEQEAIVERAEQQLAALNRMQAELELNFAAAVGMRQSILRHAFAGKLVPQDPNDEPASELLKRIAAQRAGQSGKIKARRARAATA